MRLSLPGARAVIVAGAAAALAGVLATAGPAMATSNSSDWNLAGGDKWQVNAWHCGLYTNACDWKASTKLVGTNPGTAQTIQNRTELEAHGLGATIEISKEPKATLTMKSSSLGEVRWTNTNAWIADNSGQMKPSKLSAYVSVKSCGSGRVNANINVSEKCVTAGAF